MNACYNCGKLLGSFEHQNFVKYENKDIVVCDKCIKNYDKTEKTKKSNKVKCLECGSTQITANKRGFSLGQALAFGVIGGMVGKDKIIITCLNCGHKWEAGK